MIHIKGLENTSIHAYYQGTILQADKELFKVVEYRDRKFQGHTFRDGVWIPQAHTAQELSIIFPKEGYVLIDDCVHALKQRIRRTRRKGFTSETYALNPLLSSARPLSLTNTRALAGIFSTSVNKDYAKAITAIRRKDSKGYVFSKDLCINKKSNARELHLRGLNLGLIKRDGLELPTKFKVFQQELEEYNIPITLV